MTSNYIKDFIQVENNNAIKSNRIQDNTNFTSTNIKTKQNENIINQIKMNTPMNNNINNLRNFDSSKTFSTKNANGKKFVFNEKPEKSEVYQQINLQGSNNNLLRTNIMNNNIDKINNLNRFTKIGKENSITQKASDKIRNLFTSKFAEK